MIWASTSIEKSLETLPKILSLYVVILLIPSGTIYDLLPCAKVNCGRLLYFADSTLLCSTICVVKSSTNLFPVLENLTGRFSIKGIPWMRIFLMLLKESIIRSEGNKFLSIQAIAKHLVIFKYCIVFVMQSRSFFFQLLVTGDESGFYYLSASSYTCQRKSSVLVRIVEWRGGICCGKDNIVCCNAAPSVGFLSFLPSFIFFFFNSPVCFDKLGEVPSDESSRRVVDQIQPPD